MDNPNNHELNHPSTGSEFSRHWLLVLVCAVGIGVGVSALPFYTQGIFIEAWVADFGWTRAQASLGILGSTLALAAVLPFIGLIVDRYGLVRPVMVSLLGLALAYVLLGLFVQSITTFVMLAMLQAILGSASSPLAYTRAINTVFNKQRGLALGIALSGAGVAATFGPTLISGAVAEFGWRGAYFAMALFTLVVGAACLNDPTGPIADQLSNLPFFVMATSNLSPIFASSNTRQTLGLAKGTMFCVRVTPSEVNVTARVLVGFPNLSSLSVFAISIISISIIQPPYLPNSNPFDIQPPLGH